MDATRGGVLCATLTNRTWNAGNLIDPDFFGIACVPHTGCTAVGAQPQGANSAPLAMSDPPGPGPGALG